MQSDKAAKLRKEWGNKPCNHPYVLKEYYLGAHTGDYVCTQCGEVGSREYLESFQEKNKSV